MTDRTRSIIHRRCLDCYYVLDGLAARACPECGRVFNPIDPTTYTARPKLIRWRLWLPGLTLAILLGSLTTALLLASGSLGTGLTFGVPLSIGAILGYRIPGHWVALVLFAVAEMFVVGFVIITADLAGLFCGLILVVIFLVPAMVGALLGAALRISLRQSSFSQNAYLPVVAFAMVPLLWSLLEGDAGRLEPVRITTRAHIDASPEEVWNTLMFYEEVGRKPPLLLRLGLPQPVSTQGTMDEVGDIKVCLYDKGRLVKVIVEREPPERLVFVVTDQQIGFERSVRLTGGRFELAETSDGGTRISLTTEYEPLLAPRFVWYWAEAMAVHTLHEHVLAGMVDKIGGM